MAISDVYQIRLNGTYGSPTWSNVWWYLQTAGLDTPNNAEELALEFNDRVIPPLAELQGVAAVYTDLTVINYRNPEDYFVRTDFSSDGGQISGDGLPSGVAFQYRFARPRPGTRNGYKRFIGVPESIAAGNTWVPDAADAYLLAARMTETQEGSLGSWVPVIVGGDKELGVNPAIRYQVTTCAPLNTLTTQANRRRRTTGVVPPP